MVTAGLVDYINRHYRVYFLMDKRRNRILILIVSTKLPVAPRWYLISPNTGGFVTGANIQIVNNNKLPIRRASLAKLPASLACGKRVMLLFSVYLSVMIILDIMKLSCTMIFLIFWKVTMQRLRFSSQLTITQMARLIILHILGVLQSRGCIRKVTKLPAIRFFAGTWGHHPSPAQGSKVKERNGPQEYFRILSHIYASALPILYISFWLQGGHENTRVSHHLLWRWYCRPGVNHYYIGVRSPTSCI